MAVGVWDFTHDNGPTKRFFDGEGLKIYLTGGGKGVFRGVRFSCCDFQGFFESETQIAFYNCIFENCDLGLTTWTNVKFSSCIFKFVSIGQTKFNNCEFRSCKWANIGLSPNGLDLSDTYISNPCSFIESAYTNTNTAVLKANGAPIGRQLYKLEETKATIARRLLKNLQAEGDEDAFYDAVKIFQVQQTKSKKAEAWYKIIAEDRSIKSRFGGALSWAVWCFESFILKLFGNINNWGASITRPILLFMASMIFFGLLYSRLSCATIQVNSFVRSVDIGLLAGYTNYGQEKCGIVILTQMGQLVVSVVLYTISFATIISRFSRVR